MLTINRLLTDANLAPLVFVSADNNLLAAAQAAGLQIDNPQFSCLIEALLFIRRLLHELPEGLKCQVALSAAPRAGVGQALCLWLIDPVLDLICR